jgi:hypothetical protein
VHHAHELTIKWKGFERTLVEHLRRVNDGSVCGEKERGRKRGKKGRKIEGGREGDKEREAPTS